MSRLLTSPTRPNPHVLPYYRDWVTSDLVIVDNAIGATSLPTFTQITANSSIHTKATTYTDIIASTAAPITLMRVQLKATATTNTVTSALVDIAQGASSSEVDIVVNLNAGQASDYTGNGGFQSPDYRIPVSLPAGTRISARCQALISSDTVDVHITTFSGTNRPAWAIDTLGADTATSRGTTVTLGTSNVEGEWTQITAATAAAYSGIVVGVGGAGDISIQGGPVLLDLGTGAAASEVAFLSDLTVGTTAAESLHPPLQMPIHKVDIPAGTRIAARMQGQAAFAQNLDLILYGIR